MSKLIKIKDFLRLNQAADYLSKELDETVNIADIYQLALEEKIKVSVQLINPTIIHFTYSVSPEDAKKIIFQNRDKTLQLFESLLEVMPESNREIDEENVIDMINCCKNNEEWVEHDSGRYTVPPLNNGFVLFEESNQDCQVYRWFCSRYISLNGYNFDQYVSFTRPMNLGISGIFDLMLEGEGKLILERLYQDQVNGEPILSFNHHGLFIKHRKVYWDNSWTDSAINFIEDDEEVMYQVLTKSDDQSLSELPFDLPVDQCHLISGGLPSDANIVIRSSELIRFSTELINPRSISRDGQVNPKTKNSYLKVIYSLSQYAADGLTNRKSKNSEVVIQALSSKGIDMPVNERTLREYIHEGKLLSE
jgi:hypothetical protein